MSIFLTFILALIILILIHGIGLALSYPWIRVYNKVIIDGYTIHYKTSGQGEKKVILIHGMFSSLHCWDKFLDYKTKNVEYFSIDLPQMAESHSNKLDVPVDQIEDLIYKFSKHLDLKSPSIVGCSLGGLVAYLTKIKYSEYFDKCVIVASPFNSKILSLPLYKLSFLSPIANLLVNPIIIAFSYARISKSKLAKCFPHVFVIFCKFRRTMHFKASVEYLRLIEIVEQRLVIPTKVENYYFLWGTQDHMVKKTGFDNFLGQNKRLNYDEIPEASHHPMESHPALFEKKLSSILKH